MSSLAGQIVDRSYRLYEQLGQGGMGAVYRASQLLTGRSVALKLVSHGQVREQPADAAEHRRLHLALAREFQTLASLHHPNIIRVLGYGFDDDLGPYFTMELLQGPQTLLEAAAEHPLEGKVLLITQLLRVLVYVHQRGVLHRDIKPSNVLVVNGEVKLLDFGIAAQIKSVSNLAGTLEFMAPELLLGQQPSVQSDLYSVGILLYQILTGIFPYSRDSLTSMLEDLLGEDAELTFAPGVASFLVGYHRSQSLAAREAGSEKEVPLALLTEATPLPLPRELPTALGDIARRLIARQPQDRPHNASEALKELATALHLSVPLETAATRESFLQATELVGRDSELQLLISGLAQAKGGQGSAFLIGGESGIGKSRLVSELRTQALVHGFWVVEGQSVTEGGLYFQEVLPLMRALCIRSDLTDSEATLLKPFVPDIAALLGRGVSDLLVTNPEEVQRRLFQLLSQLLGKLSKPLLLLLEDLHWARRETLAWMAHLLQGLSGCPVLLIGTFRSDESPDLPSRFPAAQYLFLPRLGSEEISRLSESILGAAGKDTALVSYLQRQTEGNVFFLVEIMRALAENAGELQRIHQGELPDQVLTAGIERIVDRRLERVPAAYGPALELAAMFGRKLNLELLEHAFPSLVLPSFLVECANAAVLESHGNDWQFAHDKLRENLLRRQRESEKRQRLHLQIAETLEALWIGAKAAEQKPDSGTLGYRSAILGHHFRQAGLADKALQYYQQAGDQSAKLFLYEEALVHYELAEESLRLLPSTPVLQRRQVGILTQQVQCSILKVPPERNLQRVAQAQQLLESLRIAGLGEPTDRLRMARLDHDAGRLFIYLGKYTEAAACFERVIPIAQELQDEDLVGIAQSSYGRLLINMGQISKAIQVFEPAVLLIERCLRRDIETLRAYSTLAIGFGRAGRGRDLVRLLGHVQPWLAEIQEVNYLIVFYVNFGCAYVWGGDPLTAFPLLERALDLAENRKKLLMLYAIFDLIAMSHQWCGDHETALKYCIRALDVRQQAAGRFVLDFAEANRADILLGLGRSEEAIALAEKVVTTRHGSSSMFALSMAERVWGRALARLGKDPTEVDTHLRHSLTIASDVGNLIEAIETEIAWGQAMLERQNLTGARTYLQRARARITDEMLPGARDRFLRIIEEGLKRCGTSFD